MKIFEIIDYHELKSIVQSGKGKVFCRLEPRRGNLLPHVAWRQLLTN